MTARRRTISTLVGLAIVLIGAVVFRLHAGPGGIGRATDPFIIELRWLMVCSAAAVGAALAVSGALLQAILRNPLASPFILGLTSGAGLGIVLATYAGYLATGAIVAMQPPVWAAVVGAFAALGLVFVLSQRRGLIDPVHLVLVGVIVSVICGAATTFIQFLLPDRGMAVYTRWVMGTISENTPWSRVALVGFVTIAGTGIAVLLGRALDSASLNDDEAASVGVRLGLLRLVCFGLAGVLTGLTVSIAGPIGFVGLICPHLVRILAGARHATLMLGSALAGAALLIIADAGVALIRLPAGRMPVGVLTALVGGPLFIFLLRRRGFSMNASRGDGT